MNADMTLTIIACAVVTVSMRALPLIFLSGINLPAILRDWLGFIPVAIMSSIVAMDLVGRWHISLAGGAIATVSVLASIIVGSLTRSLFATVCMGVVSYLALHH